MRFIYSKTFGVFSICLVIVAFTVFLQAKGWLGWIQYAAVEAPRPVFVAAKNILSPVKNFFGTIYQLRNITQENISLNSEIKHLQSQQVELDQLRKENEALRKELGFTASAKLNLVPCTVLAQDSFGLGDAITLNCGSNQGVVKGLAIVSQGFFVGKIIDSKNNISWAMLATSAKFSSDARITNNNEAGVVRGSFGSGLILDQLSQNIPVDPGSMVATAGIDSNIPKNIPIGQIGQTLSSNNDLFKKMTIISPIDFNGLEFVFAVLP